MTFQLFICAEMSLSTDRDEHLHLSFASTNIMLTIFCKPSRQLAVITTNQLPSLSIYHRIIHLKACMFISLICIMVLFQQTVSSVIEVNPEKNLISGSYC